MRIVASSLLVLFAVAVSTSGVQAQESFKLKAKGVQKWKMFLPSETWTPVGGEIAVPHAGGSGFAVTVDGRKLRIDTDGDGQADTDVKGIKGFIKLRGKTEDGSKFAYYVRLRLTGTAWEWAASGVMKGKAHGVSVAIVDQNNNGAYDDYGVDAVIIGRSATAGYLSRVVNLKGKVYNFEVAASGSEMKTTPYEGAVGTLDLRSQYKSHGRLMAAIVVDEGGENSFEVASAKKGMLVPVGTYTLKTGMAAKGSETALIRAGEMQSMEVKADSTTALAWGAPIAMDVNFTAANGQVKVAPTDLKFFGAGGEEYHSWIPDGSSPKLLIKDAKTGKLLETGRFGGC